MSSNTLMKSPVDVELIAQRILKLAEIATLEHLESLARSQAEALVEFGQDGVFGLNCLDYGFDGMAL